MLDVSTPIQAHGSAENIAENQHEMSVFGDNAQKKDKLGVFSKILDGLTGKNRGKAAESGSTRNVLAGSEIPLEENTLNTNEKGVTSLLAGKTLPKSGKIPFLPTEKNVEEEVFPMFADFQNQNPELDSILNLLDDEKNIEFSGLNAKTNLSTGTEDLTAESLLERGGIEIVDINSFVNGSNGAGDGEETLDSASGGKSKARRSDSAASFNSETDLSTIQLSGEKNSEVAALHSRNLSSPQESREARNQELRKGRERAKIEVRDFRTVDTSVDSAKTPSTLFLSSEKVDAEIKVDLRSEVRLMGQPQDRSVSDQSMRAGFQDALSRRLGDHLSADIVKQATIVLRNHGEGTIRLSLKPEALGDVKIRVEMTENKITGHIVVESSEAFKALQRELPVLEKQFQDSGFSEAKLDLSFAGEGENFGAESRENDNDFGFSYNVAASRYDAGIEVERTDADMQGVTVISNRIISGRSAVNILA